MSLPTRVWANALDLDTSHSRNANHFAQFQKEPVLRKLYAFGIKRLLALRCETLSSPPLRETLPAGHLIARHTNSPASSSQVLISPVQFALVFILLDRSTYIPIIRADYGSTNQNVEREGGYQDVYQNCSNLWLWSCCSGYRSMRNVQDYKLAMPEREHKRLGSSNGEM
ncbi:hypothetical protein EJ05DRAFT_500323 [Pseudovirgaria hyperparasitica]|uniref:Uncharacterized protein n=1 Tax=Pseudovirgaria hyperparasitica TaxID=470096 RepID=A0A6A6WAF1_9PEZI|nr:uncharacterized protein EJ05DRAFT_500323 [Pseudovirgaria hyperparasitica]KAF2758806.1 hypothetical protein EJ05DRAFT_500323 [Pseudovirgaria hyperparasitica]